ncbi:MAG: glutamine synthetase III [Ferruginibacter sp.]
MSSLRFNAIESLNKNNLEKEEKSPARRVTAIFNENVFTLKTARHYLSDDAFKSLLASIQGGKKIDRAMGNNIANGLRAWAEKGLPPILHTGSAPDRSVG